MYMQTDLWLGHKSNSTQYFICSFIKRDYLKGCLFIFALHIKL